MPCAHFLRIYSLLQFRQEKHYTLITFQCRFTDSLLLVIDDDARIHQTFKAILAKYPIEFESVLSAEEALEKLRLGKLQFDFARHHHARS